MKLTTILLAASLGVFAIACDGGDDAPNPTATAEQPSGGGGGQPQATQPASGGAGTTLGGGAPGDQPTPGGGGGAPGGNSPTPLPPNFTDAFGFAPEPRPATGAALLVDVRVGAHEGFDRIVFEFTDAQRPSGSIKYEEDVIQCGSGMPVNLPGSHVIVVHFDTTNAHTESGQLSIPSNEVDGPGNSILRSESICDFEAVVEWAVGVDGEQLFAVTLLENPNRVVIDVAH